jgi:hypothetical protein
MADYTRYPNGDDLEALITSAGLVANYPQVAWSGFDWDGLALAGVKWFEGQVGRKMLAVSATRTFDVPTGTNRVLALRADLVSVSSLTVNGVNQVSGTDYFLQPDNSLGDGDPFAWIEFALWFGWNTLPRRAVSITGLWGFGTTIPADAWNGMLTRAAALACPAIALNIGKGLQSREAGDEKETYARGQGNGPLIEERAGWQAQADAAVGNYVRVESYIV